MKNKKLIKELEFKIQVLEEKERVFNNFNEIKDLIKNCLSFQHIVDLVDFINCKWLVLDDYIRTNYLIFINNLIRKSINEIHLNVLYQK